MPDTEKPSPNTVEGAVAEMGKLAGYESPNLGRDLKIEGEKLINALDNLRKNNPDGADRITEACFAKVADLRERLAAQPDQKQVIDGTRGKLAELGGILKNAPPSLTTKPDLKEKVLSVLTETAREKDIKALVDKIRDVSLEEFAAREPNVAEAKGVETVSVGHTALARNSAPMAVAQSPTTDLGNIKVYASADTKGLKGAMKTTGD